MDFDLTDEHEMFRATIREFVNREIRPVAREWEHAGRYPTGISVSDAELAALNLKHAKFHGEWNYTLMPNKQQQR